MYFIAEIGSNHNQDWNRCVKLITESKRSGFNAVKFQLFNEKLYENPDNETKEILNKSKLPVEWIPEIKKICENLEMDFGCTPFYNDAINQLKDYVDFWKISSFDVKRNYFIYDIILSSKQNQKIFFSTGLISDIDEIIIFSKRSNNLIPLYCVSKYPTKISDIDFSILEYFKRYFENFGYSDHSAKSEILHNAIFFGTKYIELHVDLDDQNGLESKYGHCWKMSNIKSIIDIYSIQSDLLKPKQNNIDISFTVDKDTGLRKFKK